MLWLGFAALALFALGILLWPLLRRQAGAVDRKAHDVAVYKAQLAEVAEERARGAISDAEANAATLEIQRRLLRADAAVETGVGRSGGTIAGAVAVLLLVPVLGAGLYVALGRPEAAQVSQEDQRAQAERAERLREDTERMIAQLRERLKADPQRLDGWILLGRSLLMTDRPEDAVEAFSRAIDLAPDDADAYGFRAEALTLAADGSVTAEAQRDFHAVLERDPQHPGARYYLGLARLQEGDTRGAYDDWYGLAAEAPADAPWLETVQARLRELAPRLGVPLAQAVPPSRPAAAAPQSGPTREQAEAAQQMSAEDRTAMIRSMVEGLAARLEQNPNDADGWLRLARARDVLGEADAGREALRRAVAAAPDRIDARLALAFNLAGATVTSRDPLPADAVEAFAAVLERAPDHPQALWFTGRAAFETGDKTTAAARWNRLLAMLPPDSPEARELTERLAALNRP
jgi:cytochrome c-type biogenesis protein CcmH